MLKIVDNMMNENVKEEALTSLPLIVELIKNSSFESSIAYTKKFLTALIGAIQDEYDTETLINELRCIKDIIALYDQKFFTADELKVFSEELLKIIMRSDERKIDTKDLVEADMEEDEK